MSEEPVTFREPSYAIFDPVNNGVLCTPVGNLAIFTVKEMADRIAAGSGRRVEVRKVWITEDVPNKM